MSATPYRTAGDSARSLFHAVVVGRGIPEASRPAGPLRRVPEQGNLKSQGQESTYETP